VRFTPQPFSTSALLDSPGVAAAEGESPLCDFPLGDESGYVIEGSATMELLDSGESIEMKAGDRYEQAQDQRLPLDHPRHGGTPPARS